MQLARRLYCGTWNGLKSGVIIAFFLVIDFFVIRVLLGSGGGTSLVKSFAPLKPPETLWQFLVYMAGFIALLFVTGAGTYAGLQIWPSIWGPIIGGCITYLAAWACIGVLSDTEVTNDSALENNVPSA